MFRKSIVEECGKGNLFRVKSYARNAISLSFLPRCAKFFDAFLISRDCGFNYILITQFKTAEGHAREHAPFMLQLVVLRWP